MKIIIGITGASGSVYAKKLIDVLCENDCEVFCVFTRYGEEVTKFELGDEVYLDIIHKTSQHFDNNAMWSSIASGSFNVDSMVVIPCSMKTLACIANGITDNLLVRAADVTLKERRKLILVTRESPYNSIHLKNMLVLSNIGVNIIPASPSFYHRPQTIDDLVNAFVMRVCDAIGVKTTLAKRWGE